MVWAANIGESSLEGQEPAKGDLFIWRNTTPALSLPMGRAQVSSLFFGQNRGPLGRVACTEMFVSRREASQSFEREVPTNLKVWIHHQLYEPLLFITVEDVWGNNFNSFKRLAQQQ